MSAAFAPRVDPHLDAAIREALDDAGLTPHAYAYVADLERNRFGAWRPDDDIYPASVVKVPVMAEAFRQIAAGELRADDLVEITESNQTTTWGESPFRTGVRASVRDLVERMITHSDNVATNQLFDVLRRERVTRFMRELGLATFLLGRKLSGSEPLIIDPEMVGRNRLAPREIGELLALIALDRVPGASEQRAILGRCVDDEKLARGARDGDVFQHKTGETSEHSHDAGILATQSGSSFVIVLYTTPPPRDDGADADHFDPRMRRWMRSIRERL